MNDDRDNSNIQSSSEGSSTEVNSSSEEKDTPSSEQSIESDKEDPTNKDSSVNGWLLLLVLLIVLGTGFYFYTYKKDSSFFTTLPDSLIKLFSTAPQLKNLPSIQPKKTLATPSEEVIRKIEEATSLDTQPKEIPAQPSKELIEKTEEAISPDTQSKEIPAKFSGEIVDQTKRTTLFDKTINENEKTIDLLRNEIQSLKAELKQKSSTSQNFRIKRPHISGGFIEEKPEETTQQVFSRCFLQNQDRLELLHFFFVEIFFAESFVVLLESFWTRMWFHTPEFCQVFLPTVCDTSGAGTS